MWPNPQSHADLVTFAEEIFNRKLHFCALYAYSSKCTKIYDRTQSKIYDRVFIATVVNGFKPVTVFAKKSHL